MVVNKLKALNIMIAQVLIISFTIGAGFVVYSFYKETAVSFNKELPHEEEACDFFQREKTLVDIEKISIYAKKELLDSFANGSKEEYAIFRNRTSSPQVVYMRIPKYVEIVDAYVVLNGSLY